jgi:hypothetical protein
MALSARIVTHGKVCCPDWRQTIDLPAGRVTVTASQKLRLTGKEAKAPKTLGKKANKSTALGIGIAVTRLLLKRALHFQKGAHILYHKV